DDALDADWGAARLIQRGVGCAEHQAGLVAIAILDIDHRGIDALARDIFHRHGPGAGLAGPVTDLQPVAHDIVVRHLTAAILAASDRDRHRLRDRADPDFAVIGWMFGARRRNGHIQLLARH